MDSVQSDSKLLSVLNDDCIYKILEWLPVDELGLVSTMCRRLHQLCDNHFRRKCLREANGEVEICLWNDEPLRCAKYVKFFNKFIKTLRISAVGATHSKNLATFMKTKCDPNLRHIIIDGDLDMKQFFAEMKSFFRNVEIVEFSDVNPDDGSTSLVDRTISTTLSLRNLRKKNFDAIFEQKYRKLKHFHWRENDLDHTLKADKLKTFLQKNEHIQCIELNYQSGNEQLLSIITTIIDSALELQHLSLNVSAVNEMYFGIRMDFRQFCVHLKVLCERDNFKSLHLRFGGSRSDTDNVLMSRAKELVNCKQLTKIRMYGDGLFSFATALRQFIHLKSIVLDWWYYDDDLDDDQNRQWSTIDELAALVDKKRIVALPQIEEVTFWLGDKNRTLAFLMQIARHWVNLKKIYLTYNNSRLFHGPFPVDEINEARKKLKNACELTIFLDRANYNKKNVDRDLVKLKYVKFDNPCFCPSQHCTL